MARPRNIVVLIADSLRDDACHGPDGNAGLPFVAAHGTRFTQARASGCWTLPATASMFTGLMPHEHGADSQTRGVRPEVPTLAEKLREHGYRTRQVTANIATTEIFGLDRGFDEVVRIWKHVPDRYNRFHEAMVLMGKPRLRKKLFSPEYITGKLASDLEASKVWLQDTVDDIFDHARRILAEDERAGKGSFLFLNLMETHFPYHVGPEFEFVADGPIGRLREMRALYHLVNQTWVMSGQQPIRHDMMRLLRERQRRAWLRLAPKVDSFVAELRARDGNLVVFGADHGDCFGEQGWAYHFSNVADGGNRVPLYWLRHDHDAARTVDVPISARDLFRGVLHEVGDPAGETHPADEPERSFPVMQSCWYNNQGRTLPEYRYNQICFVEAGQRWMHRRGEWYSAPPAGPCGEPSFVRLPKGTNPLHELPVAPERRAALQSIHADFETFSARVGHGA